MHGYGSRLAYISWQLCSFLDVMSGVARPYCLSEPNSPDYKTRDALFYSRHVLAHLLVECSALQPETLVARVFILVVLHPLPSSFPPLPTKRSIPEPRSG